MHRVFECIQLCPLVVDSVVNRVIFMDLFVRVKQTILSTHIKYLKLIIAFQHDYFFGEENSFLDDKFETYPFLSFPSYFSGS